MSHGSVSPNGGYITHYVRHSVTAPDRDTERGVLIPLGELNAAAAGADDGSHLVFGCVRVILPKGNHRSETRGMAHALFLQFPSPGTGFAWVMSPRHR